MQQPKKRLMSITVYQWSMGVVLILIVAGFFALIHQQLKFSSAMDERERSMRLVAELRQSSNDLARLVRNYLVTGNARFKEQFHAVHDIRDGIRPRPNDYSLAYWDTHAIEHEDFMPHPEEVGEKVSLIELLRRAGITSFELSSLKRSKELSDQLVEIENQAIALFDSESPPSPEAVDQALSMLADSNFIARKSEIMGLIIGTEELIIDRTQTTVDEARFWITVLTEFLLLCGLILFILIVMTGLHMRSIIGGSVSDLQRIIREIGEGDFVTPIHVSKGNEESIIGWLAKKQRRLAALNLGHFKAIIDSSDDAIASKTTQGIVTSWNDGAERIFGYSADEIIGKPMTTIIPHERLHEEPEILAKIMRGEKVDHYITQRQHKDGHLIDVSVTVSPIYSRAGDVIGASKIARDITAAVAAEAEIKRLAFFDALTGLANRRLLHDRLKQMHAIASREGTCLMVAFIDLDNFKPLNDSQGHEAGDELLKQAAARLMSCVRKSDTVSRFGGDEFVVLLRGPKRSDPVTTDWADVILAKIRESLNEPYVIGDISHVCTPSIGVSQLVDTTTEPEDLIVQADEAMYAAKKAGKNSLEYYPLRA